MKRETITLTKKELNNNYRCTCGSMVRRYFNTTDKDVSNVMCSGLCCKIKYIVKD